MKFVDKFDLKSIGDFEGDIFRCEICFVVEYFCDVENMFLNWVEWDRFVDEVFDEIFGLGFLELLFKDEMISDILINGFKNIYCECCG